MSDGVTICAQGSEVKVHPGSHVRVEFDTLTIFVDGVQIYFAGYGPNPPPAFLCAIELICAIKGKNHDRNSGDQ